MKQFIIDLITVKSHSNHLGANKGNPFNIAREEEAAVKTWEPAKTGCLRDAAGRACLCVYLFTRFSSWPLITPVHSDSPLETLWDFPGPIQPFQTPLNLSRFQRTLVPPT